MGSSKKCVLVLLSCTPTSRWKENGVLALRFSRCSFGSTTSLAEFTNKEKSILHFAAAASLPIKGEIGLLNCIEHSKAKGMKWMASSEMDLMLSIYHVMDVILSYALSASGRACFQKHCAYEEVVNLMNDNKKCLLMNWINSLLKDLSLQDRPFMRNILSIPRIC